MLLPKEHVLVMPLQLLMSGLQSLLLRYDGKLTTVERIAVLAISIVVMQFAGHYNSQVILNGQVICVE